MLRKISRTVPIWIIVVIQGLCAAFFITEFAFEVFGKNRQPVSWKIHEFVEVSANIGLILGLILGGVLLRQLVLRNHKVEGQLRVVAGEFNQLLEEHFATWDLSPSEKDVAYFAIKGLSNTEIAELRDTSAGTVKAQMNAVYKKAGVVSRTQLLGYFIEELMAQK